MKAEKGAVYDGGPQDKGEVFSRQEKSSVIDKEIEKMK